MMRRSSIIEQLRKSHAYHSTATNLKAGMGLVQDSMIPSSIERSKPLFQHIRDPRTVSVIGAPMTYGQSFIGTDYAPSLIREAGLHKNLSKLGWRVEDMQDLDFDAILQKSQQSRHNDISHHFNAKNSLYVGKGCQALADSVEQKALENKFPLILGGDHSIGIGSLAGILRARPNTGVLWIDAHADLNTPLTSETGNMHGMPLGLLVEGVFEDHASIPGCEWLAFNNNDNGDVPRLSPDSLVYIGLRDVDVAERKAIRELGILAFTMFDIDKYGIGEVMEMALDHLLQNQPNRPIHLSYDIDAIDPALAPATGTSVHGGLNFREAHYVVEAAVKTGLLASADLVEVNPTLAEGRDANETTLLGLHIVESILGKSII